MLHRAIFGSLERFFGALTEPTAGDGCPPVSSVSSHRPCPQACSSSRRRATSPFGSRRRSCGCCPSRTTTGRTATQRWRGSRRRASARRSTPAADPSASRSRSPTRTRCEATPVACVLTAPSPRWPRPPPETRLLASLLATRPLASSPPRLLAPSPRPLSSSPRLLAPSPRLRRLLAPSPRLLASPPRLASSPRRVLASSPRLASPRRVLASRPPASPPPPRPTLADYPQVPILSVVGEAEVGANALKLEMRKGGELGELPLERAIEVLAAAAEKAVEPIEAL